MVDQFFSWTWYECFVALLIICIYIACIFLHRKVHPNRDMAGPLGTYVVLAGIAGAFYALSANGAEHPKAELFFFLTFLAYSAWFAFHTLQDLYHAAR